MKEKILLIVPHQDDEINIAGGVLYSLKNKENVYVVYVTNGDFVFDARYRYKEAIKSLKTLGIRKDNIIFLGYSDQAYDKDTHIYTSNGDWQSENGYTETYGALGIQEWNYKKYGEHCKFNKENVKRNIKEVIEDLLPEIIICIDLDFHPDHIMTSLCFEKAMGELLQNRKQYHPEVLKTFAYENAYLGPNDFFEGENNNVKFNTNSKGVLESNPYYNLKDAINIPIANQCYSYNLFTNPLWRAIKCHVSQDLVLNATKIINNNYMYWKRETKNLLYNAEIRVSSSKKEYLNDFVIADTKDILNGDKQEIKYDEGIWIPDDKDNLKEIDISLKEKKLVKYIKLYSGRINNNYINDIKVSIDDKETVITLKKELINFIDINKEIKNIRIKVLDNICYNGFSEIEIIGDETEDIVTHLLLKTDKKNKHSNVFKIFDIILIKLTILYQKIIRKAFIRLERKDQK